jgi:flagellar motor switch protein FliM
MAKILSQAEIDALLGSTMPLDKSRSGRSTSSNAAIS